MNIGPNEEITKTELQDINITKLYTLSPHNMLYIKTRHTHSHFPGLKEYKFHIS